jgi:hypothetical protein
MGQLASKPGADEIALIVGDAAAKPEGLIWDGTDWGNEKQLTTGTLSNWNTETIAVEYMQAGTNEGAIRAETNSIRLGGMGQVGTQRYKQVCYCWTICWLRQKL